MSLPDGTIYGGCDVHKVDCDYHAARARPARERIDRLPYDLGVLRRWLRRWAARGTLRARCEATGAAMCCIVRSKRGAIPAEWRMSEAPDSAVKAVAHKVVNSEQQQCNGSSLR